MVLHIGFCLREKTLTPKNIGEGLRGPHRKFWKETLFAQNDKNKNVRLILDTTPIKSLTQVKKLIYSLINPSIT